MREQTAGIVWLITGASGGLGRVLAERALLRGDRVVGTARHVTDLLPLMERYGASLIPVELDGNDEVADREIVDRVVSILGRLDVVVNNAGYDNTVYSKNASWVADHIETNLFSALWVSQAALMYMRVHTGGCIVQTFGLSNHTEQLNQRLFERRRSVFDGFSEHLARQVAPFDIKVTICVPNELYNEWIEINPVRTYAISPY